MRLIDVDKLLETLQDLEPHCDNKQYENGMLKMLRYYMPQIINDEPTAYDIGKVVEELETNKQNALEVEESIKEYNVWNKAIEIVKQGGVSDDVCEWKMDNVGASIGCRSDLHHTGHVNRTYCPYCGKKIKVVEYMGEEEHKQLAVWLEELKSYREIGTVEECKESVLDIEKAYNKGYADGSLSVTSEIRNKVIDDFVCYMCNEFDSKYAAIEEHTREYVIKLVHSIGEELKAGRKNE